MSNPTALRQLRLKEIENVPQTEMTGEDFSIDFRADIQLGASNLAVKVPLIRRAMMDNRRRFKNAVVLDVGCSLGLLSMVAVRCGAKKVIAFDNSNITQLTKQVVKDNGFEDVITVIRGDLGTLQLPDGITEVDIIISNWIGTQNLYFRSIIPWVLIARDRWLKKEWGIIIPDSADIFLNGVDGALVREDEIDWWDDILPHNFNMRALIPSILKEPVPKAYPSNWFGTTTQMIHSLDLNKAKLDNLGFETTFRIYATHNFDLQAFSSHFHIGFPFRGAPTHETVLLNAKGRSVVCNLSHTGFYVKEYGLIKAGEEIYGTFKMDEPLVEDGIISKLRYTITWNVDGAVTKKFNETEEFVLTFDV